MAMMTRMAVPIIMRIYAGNVSIDNIEKAKNMYIPSYLSTLSVEKLVIRQVLSRWDFTNELTTCSGKFI